MIHIDNLDGEGTIFMSTDDGTQSIGHVEKEYASILQDVLESYDWYVKEVKRLQKENKILAKYMDIVQKYDDALLADGDTDPRWSELYD